jgi:hypothetical protein
VGPVVIRICDGARTEIEDLRRVQGLFDELLERHAHIAMLLVFTHGTPLPDAATQRHARDSMKLYDHKLVLAVAVLGLGFWASAVRAGLATIARVVRRGDLWIEGSVEQAVTRMTMDLVGLDEVTITRCYEQLWAELQQPARHAS